MERPLLDRPQLIGRSDGLDLLRVGLALWVVLTHLAEWGPLTATGIASPFARLDHWTESLFQTHGETHPAVVAFIVLSGYCVHRNGARRDGWRVKGYAVKRFWRIVPVYVVASLFGATMFLIASRANAASTWAASATGQITAQGLGLKLSALTGVIPVAHMPSNPLNGYEGNGPLYTVAAEMWLYAFYAAAVTLLLRRRISDRSLLALVGVLFAGGLLVVAERPDLQAWWFNGSLIGFLPLWWLGAHAVGTPPGRRLMLVAAVIWVACTVWLHGSTGLPVEELRLLAFGVLIAAAICRIDAARVHAPRRLAPLTGCGYSLYALHAPVLILGVALGVTWPLVLLAALLLGPLAFRLLEGPTTRLGKRLATSGSAAAPRPATMRT